MKSNQEILNAADYIRKIRNPEKREYATAYMNYLTGNRRQRPDYKVSYMAAQAVRMELEKILAKTIERLDRRSV